MDTNNTPQYSLADFFLGDSEDVLTPSEDFTAWREASAWAIDLYEPSLHDAAIPRTALGFADGARPVINMSSYNYMGLVHHPATIAAAQEALGKYGTGACGSPLLSGMSVLHRQLEHSLSKLLGRESTMLFNSGYGGALGALAGLLRKGDVAILDNKAHLCLIDGARLSGAQLQFFDHNDPASLDIQLEKSKGRRRLVAVEGIYSMDGDMADLPAILEVAERHGVPVFIDEAHSIMGCGAHGRGVAEHYGVEGRIGLQYATFSKALAGVGSFVSGSKRTLDYLRFYANTYGFSCALPPATVAGILAGIEVVEKCPAIREQLWTNAEYFRRGVQGLGISTGHSTTYVVPLVIGSDRKLLYDLGHEMRRRGLFLAPVDYPSVPQDQVRFRASVTAAHTRADLDEALNIIEDTIAKRLRS